MRFIRIMLAIIVSISLLIVLLFSLLGLGIFSGVHTMVDEANKDVIQTITQVEDKIQIKVPLYEEKSLQYTHIPICQEEEKNDHFFERVVLENGLKPSSSTLGCSDGICTVVVHLDSKKEIPEYLYLYQENKHHQCEKTKYKVAGHIYPLQYTAKIEFTEALKKLLKIHAEDKHYSLTTTNSAGIFVYQVMGTKKLSLSYNKPIETDVLLVNATKKASIMFTLVPDTTYDK